LGARTPYRPEISGVDVRRRTWKLAAVVTQIDTQLIGWTRPQRGRRECVSTTDRRPPTADRRLASAAKTPGLVGGREWTTAELASGLTTTASGSLRLGDFCPDSGRAAERAVDPEVASDEGEAI
jgi:hypothetical protein